MNSLHIFGLISRKDHAFSGFLRQGFAIQARLTTASLVIGCDALEYHARKHRNGLRCFEQYP
jgi:hypothetical protein